MNKLCRPLGPPNHYEQGEERAVGSPEQPLASTLHIPPLHSNTPVTNLLPAAPLPGLLPSRLVPHLLSLAPTPPGAGHSPSPGSPSCSSTASASSVPSPAPTGAAQDEREPRGRGDDSAPASQRQPAVSERGGRHREPPSHPAAVSPPASKVTPAALPRRPGPG